MKKNILLLIFLLSLTSCSKKTYSKINQRFENELPGNVTGGLTITGNKFELSGILESTACFYSENVVVKFVLYQTNTGYIKKIEDNIYQLKTKKITKAIDVKSDESTYEYLSFYIESYIHYTDEEIYRLAQGEQIVTVYDKDDYVISYIILDEEAQTFKITYLS